MLSDFFVTKSAMSQAWSKSGQRLCVTKVKCADNIILTTLSSDTQNDKNTHQTLVGFGFKKLKNTAKAQRVGYEKLKLKSAPLTTQVVSVVSDEPMQAGEKVSVTQVLSVGDVVEVQGTTKGHGFAGVVKRYGFAGGPRTHGQSDRERAPGSIGNRTTPGRVFKGKRMPGHYGVVTKTVKGLVVLYIDPVSQELWLSGPLPGPITGLLRLRKTGQTKAVDLHYTASGLTEPVQTEEVEEVVTPEVAPEEVASTTEPTESDQTEVVEAPTTVESDQTEVTQAPVVETPTLVEESPTPAEEVPAPAETPAEEPTPAKPPTKAKKVTKS